MAKTIIFCADGTWNGPGQPDVDTAAKTTNVYKLFLNLDGRDDSGSTLLAKEQERVLHDPAGAVAQVAKYLHGVGDSENRLVQLLGGGLGAGLITRIVRGYTFVSRNYREGDRIVLTGFSRGAYTARALAGLIAEKGILNAETLDLENEREEAYRLGVAAWYDYRRASLARRNRSLLGRLHDAVLSLPAFLQERVPSEYLRPAQIEAVGVWDTVGALGIPVYNLSGERIDVFQFTNGKLSTTVRHGFHAVAIDELRSDFTPTLWEPREGVRQVLFPGAHSDVGGGYPETGLSDGALGWMMAQLRGCGVAFQDCLSISLKRDPLGPAHKPWEGNFLFLRALRRFPGGLVLSAAARARFEAGQAPDEPAAHPSLYTLACLRPDYFEKGKLSPKVEFEPDY